MATEEEDNRQDQLLARVGELHALASNLTRTEDGQEFHETLRQIEDLVQQLREL